MFIPFQKEPLVAGINAVTRHLPSVFQHCIERGVVRRPRTDMRGSDRHQAARDDQRLIFPSVGVVSGATACQSQAAYEAQKDKILFHNRTPSFTQLATACPSRQPRWDDEKLPLKFKFSIFVSG